MISLEVLVEEQSCERALQVLLPKIVPGTPFNIRTFEGKQDLLRRLPNRLRGYVAWNRDGVDRKIVVVVDRDDDDCQELKTRIEQLFASAGFATLTAGRSGVPAHACTRVVVQHLEAWLVGDLPALRTVYPKIPETLDRQSRYRDPDAVPGGAWRALERLLADKGYATRLEKVKTAGAIAPHMDVENNRSASFCTFRDGVRRLVDPERAT